MDNATHALIGSCMCTLSAYCELKKTFKNLQSLAGKPGQRRSYKRLKEIGLTLILTPTPEPFSDLLGLSILGAAKYLEWHSPPLTLSDIAEESRTIFKNMRLI